MITYREGGRFGNMLLHIYTIYHYCTKHKINLDNIAFSEYGLSEHGEKKYFIKCNIKNFFKSNIKFIDDKIYRQTIKNYKRYKYFEIRNIRIENDFVMYSFGWPKINLNLFGELFYRPELWEEIRSRVKYNLNEYVAFHIRRTDFVSSSCFQTLEKVEKRLLNVNYKCIVFSDDINWCKKNLKNDNLFYLEDKYLPWEEWIIMTMCKNILPSPRSTYSGTAKNMNEYFKNIFIL